MVSDPLRRPGDAFSVTPPDTVTVLEKAPARADHAELVRTDRIGQNERGLAHRGI
jgi:hypothetical protein